jgi:NAD(P)-dependent dehydrogenase (short-subunit alcohol dehydrogenase family)
MESPGAAPVLSGRVAVVTGAGGGIGRAIAEALAAEGALLCLVGRTASTVEATAARAGANALCYPTDLTDDGALMALVDRVQRDRDRVDVLVHCAGVHAMGTVAETPVSELDRQYRTNVRAPYLLTQALLSTLRRTRGQVVFVNSSVGMAARGRVGAYASSKHALRALADSLRDEVNTEGIRVLSVFLGRTASAMQAGVHAAEGREYRPHELLQPSDVATVVVTALSLPSTAEMTDVSIRPMRK